MDKINYSVARVETYTKTSITKAERHNERKNKSYSNMNVDSIQTPPFPFGWQFCNKKIPSFSE